MSERTISERPSAQSRRDRQVFWALLLLVTAVDLLCLPGVNLLGDPLAWREEARNLLLHGRLEIDASVASAHGVRGQYFVCNDQGRWYSKYGLMNALMSLPPLALEAIVSGPMQPGQADSLRILNAYNVLLATGVMAYLWTITGLYSSSAAARVAYVLATFYGTFLWYYLRVQMSEIWQVLFFVGGFYHWVRFGRGGGKRHELLGWVFLAALCLCRISYLLLLPIGSVFLLVVFARRQGGLTITAVVRTIAPAVAIVAVLGAIDQAKFGSPLLSGYHQWDIAGHRPNGAMWEGVRGFLFSPQKNIWTHFPLLIIALAGIAPFARKHPLEFALAAADFLLTFLAISKLPTWAGQWSYGPRYLLFVLPILSLPALDVFEWVIDGWKHRGTRLWKAASASIAIVAVLGSSLVMQVVVNRLDPFAWFYLDSALDRQQDVSAVQYLNEHSLPVVYWNLLRHRSDLPQSNLMKAVTTSRPGDSEFVASYQARIATYVDTPNLYWSLPNR